MKCFETHLMEFPAAAQYSFSQKLLGQTSKAPGFHRDPVNCTNTVVPQGL